MTAPDTHILCVVAARPNLMKMAPILRALGRYAPAIRTTLIHTGQHYDAAMDAEHVAALDLPQPGINLEVGSASHARQTAEVMLRFEPVLRAQRPDAVLVVGDVNSTLACALVAAKDNIPVLHVEAGLRSGDRTMPEEINRILTDQLSTLLFTTESAGEHNLALEGIPRERIHFTGNVMIDTLRHEMPRAVPSAVTVAQAQVDGFGQSSAGFGLVTLHRPSNVDDDAVLASLMNTLELLSVDLPLIFAVHPRTYARLEKLGIVQHHAAEILLLPPQGYHAMLGLMRDARLVLTDSGGIQEETTALGVPCLTLRDNTERPITITEGSNTLAGTSPASILGLARRSLSGRGKAGAMPEHWDGHAAERIAAIVARWAAEAR
jgi:UDP-N-acetylglucosamine 2-epimerase (non-hydrolysing)